MAIKYFKLLDLLQRKGLTKTDFSNLAELSSATMAKLSGHKPVNMEIIDRVCKTLKCQPGDIMEYIPDQQEEGE